MPVSPSHARWRRTCTSCATTRRVDVTAPAVASAMIAFSG
jgi:hypothetical protein